MTSHTMIAFSENDKTAQCLVGSWETAIDILCGRHDDSEELRDYARAYVVNVVEQYASEGTRGLWDWVAEGDFGGPLPTPQEIAAEWDESERKAREDGY